MTVALTPFELYLFGYQARIAAGPGIAQAHVATDEAGTRSWWCGYWDAHLDLIYAHALRLMPAARNKGT